MPGSTAASPCNNVIWDRIPKPFDSTGVYCGDPEIGLPISIASIEALCHSGAGKHLNSFGTVTTISAASASISELLEITKFMTTFVCPTRRGITKQESGFKLILNFPTSKRKESKCKGNRKTKKFIDWIIKKLSQSEANAESGISKDSLPNQRLYHRTDGYTSSGPDLSFVIIRDKGLIGIIKSQNFEFYDLDYYRTKIEEVFTPDTDNFNWCVEGNPGEKIEVKKEFVGGKEQTVTVTTDAIVQGNFAGCEFRGEFDYVKILLGSGFEAFPDSYKGVSGGGIWYQRFVTKDGKNYDVEPTLAGIACWQGKQRKMHGYKVRIITGHGWVSIYGHVRKALAEKRASNGFYRQT